MKPNKRPLTIGTIGTTILLAAADMATVDYEDVTGSVQSASWFGLQNVSKASTDNPDIFTPEDVEISGSLNDINPPHQFSETKFIAPPHYINAHITVKYQCEGGPEIIATYQSNSHNFIKGLLRLNTEEEREFSGTVTTPICDGEFPISFINMKNGVIKKVTKKSWKERLEEFMNSPLFNT
jgi:hypothetical protein